MAVGRGNVSRRLPVEVGPYGMQAEQASEQIGDEEALPLTLDAEGMNGGARGRPALQQAAEAAAPRPMRTSCMLLICGEPGITSSAQTRSAGRQCTM